MANQFDTLFSRGSHFVRQHLGEDEVTQLVEGSTSTTEVFSDGTAVWTERDPEKLDVNGEQTKRRGTLQVAVGTTVSVRDIWKIRGQRWTVHTIGPVIAGWINIDLEQIVDDRLRPVG